jgi:hypothetical protein
MVRRKNIVSLPSLIETFALISVVGKSSKEYFHTSERSKKKQNTTQN